MPTRRPSGSSASIHRARPSPERPPTTHRLRRRTVSDGHRLQRTLRLRWGTASGGASSPTTQRLPRRIVSGGVAGSSMVPLGWNDRDRRVLSESAPRVTRGSGTDGHQAPTAISPHPRPATSRWFRLVGTTATDAFCRCQCPRDDPDMTTTPEVRRRRAVTSPRRPARKSRSAPLVVSRARAHRRPRPRTSVRDGGGDRRGRRADMDSARAGRSPPARPSSPARSPAHRPSPPPRRG